MSLKRTSSVLVSLSLALASSTALAQEVGASGTVTAQAPPLPSAPAPASVESPSPVRPRAIADDGSADHDKVVGHLAVTYFGVSQIPVANGAGARENIIAPAVGVRYWMNRSLGIDVGIGFGVTSGSNEIVRGNTTTIIDSPSRTGFLLHGGVPLALAAGKHYTFELIPELNVGFGTGTIKGVPAGGVTPPDTSLSGLKLDIGARVGAEIHFGFMGIPELALQASVGLFLRRDSWKASQEANGSTTSSASSAMTIGTTVNGEPWAIFANNISALYYF